MVCFSVDSRDSYENARHKWAPEIRHYCTGDGDNTPPMLLVGTKNDISDRTISSVHGHALAREIGAAKYVECSASTQTNLCEVFEEAVKLVLYPPTKHKGRWRRRNQCGVM